MYIHKGKFIHVLSYTMQTYGRMNILIHVFLTPVLVVSGQLHSLATLPPRNSRRYALDTRLRGPQCRSGQC
jgi:hypothetical protein